MTRGPHSTGGDRHAIRGPAACPHGSAGRVTEAGLVLDVSGGVCVRAGDCVDALDFPPDFAVSPAQPQKLTSLKQHV